MCAALGPALLGKTEDRLPDLGSAHLTAAPGAKQLLVRSAFAPVTACGLPASCVPCFPLSLKATLP